MQCRACLAEILDTSYFCPSCGAAIAASEAPTVAARPRPSSPSITHARFIPGTMLAGRYRIVAPARPRRDGRGLSRRRPQARPAGRAQVPARARSPTTPTRLARFHNEVRIARQVSHPNVCRVYDIGEADGRHFLSMEYVDGEDLASLLRRIGRLPHGQGDRDRAPALRGPRRRARPRRAAPRSQARQRHDRRPRPRAHHRLRPRRRSPTTGAIDDVIAGTPGYMAPEQLAGSEVTARSDIYALGLVLVRAVHRQARRSTASDARRS